MIVFRHNVLLHEGQAAEIRHDDQIADEIDLAADVFHIAHQDEWIIESIASGGDMRNFEATPWNFVKARGLDARPLCIKGARSVTIKVKRIGSGSTGFFGIFMGYDPGQVAR
jgi:hypothetical protein